MRTISALFSDDSVRWFLFGLYGVLIVFFAFPVLVGLVGVFLPSFYFFPGLDEYGLSVRAFSELFAYHGFWKSLTLTLTIGWGATLLSFCVSILLVMSINLSMSLGRRHNNLIALFLSVPHSAFAIGLLFLIIPNGWLLRLVSPFFTGFERPPTGWILPDLYGITAIIGLSLKEIPFLLLIWLTAEKHINMRQFLDVSSGLGYSRTQAWFKIIFPQIYARTRLCLFAVLAFSLSVVDVALILSPHPIPVLSALVLQWSQDSNTSFYFVAAAASVIQLGVIVGSFCLWLLGERVASMIYRRIVINGKRRLSGERIYHGIAEGLKVFMPVVCLLAILSLILFSVSWRWRFPQSFPYQFSLKHWEVASDGLLEALWNSVSLGLAVALIAVGVAMILLEIQNHYRGSNFLVESRKILYLPLLLPQTSFLLGVQILILRLPFETFFMVLLCHLLFALPYVLMVMSDIYLAYDDRYSTIGKALGRHPVIVFFRIKGGILLSGILLGFAVAFAVSLGQYLPTIFASGGRFATLTSEAVTLAAGGNRGSLASFAVLQSFLPLLVFAFVLRRLR